MVANHWSNYGIHCYDPSLWFIRRALKDLLGVWMIANCSSADFHDFKVISYHFSDDFPEMI